MKIEHEGKHFDESTNALSLTVRDPSPAPAIATLTPASIAAGSPAFALTVDGQGFVAAATVLWDGSPRPTQLVSATRLVAAIAAADVATQGMHDVTVASPAPGGGTSAPAIFSVTAATMAPPVDAGAGPDLATAQNPRPTISALVSSLTSTCGGVAGAGGFTLDVTGSGFVNGATVTFGGQAVAASVASATHLAATIPAALVASAPVGNRVAVVVDNPAPGGGASAPAFFGLAGATVHFSTGIAPILAVCTGCHSGGGGGLPASMNLSAATAWAQLVNVAAVECRTERVTPCDPSRGASMLVDKVTATAQSPPCAGSPMPRGGVLTAAQQQAIVDWVAAGALDD